MAQRWVAELQAQGGSITVGPLPAPAAGRSTGGHIEISDTISSPEMALAVLAHELGNDRNNSITGTALGPGESFAVLNKFMLVDDIRDPVLRQKYFDSVSTDSRFPVQWDIFQRWKSGLISTAQACQEMYRVCDTNIGPA